MPFAWPTRPYGILCVHLTEETPEIDVRPPRWIPCSTATELIRSIDPTPERCGGPSERSTLISPEFTMPSNAIMRATPPTTRLTEPGSASSRRNPSIAGTERTDVTMRRAIAHAEQVRVPINPKQIAARLPPTITNVDTSPYACRSRCLLAAQIRTANPAQSTGIHRHLACDRLAPRETPSGDTTTRRSEASAIPTASAGNPTRKTIATGSGGTRSEGYMWSPPIIPEESAGRNARNNGIPSQVPSTAATPASVAAKNRTWRCVAPASRTAASLASRVDADNRVTVPTNSQIGSRIALAAATITRMALTPSGSASVTEPKPAVRYESGRERGAAAGLPSQISRLSGPITPSGAMVPARCPLSLRSMYGPSVGHIETCRCEAKI